MLMQNFGVTNKEHYGMLQYFLEWSIGKSAHGIKQVDSSVDLLYPSHLLGNVYIALCPKLCY